MSEFGELLADMRRDLTLGPFASLQTQKLVADLLGPDPNKRDRARQILSRHVELNPAKATGLRNEAICVLGTLIQRIAPHITARARDITIESAIHQRRDCKYLERFDPTERAEIQKHAAEIQLWMIGSKRTLDHRQIGNIIKAAI